MLTKLKLAINDKVTLSYNKRVSGRVAFNLRGEWPSGLNSLR